MKEKIVAIIKSKIVIIPQQQGIGDVRAANEIYSLFLEEVSKAFQAGFDKAYYTHVGELIDKKIPLNKEQYIEQLNKG